jgi:hypothetical protein
MEDGVAESVAVTGLTVVVIFWFVAVEPPPHPAVASRAGRTMTAITIRRAMEFSLT